MDFRKIHTWLAIIFFLIVVVFSTITVSYNSSTNNNNKNDVPIDLLDNRTKSGLQKGVNANNYANNNNNNNNNDNNNNNNNNNTRKNKKVSGFNPSASNNDLWGLPEKDNYMTPLFREQIDNLKDRYYTTGNFANIL
jgi:hypothetical protein